jgi:hypothetical protein
MTILGPGVHFTATYFGSRRDFQCVEHDNAGDSWLCLATDYILPRTFSTADMTDFVLDPPPGQPRRRDVMRLINEHQIPGDGSVVDEVYPALCALFDNTKETTA